jgi:enoyl-CoA hydratase
MFHRAAQEPLPAFVKHVLVGNGRETRPVSKSPHLLVEREGHVVTVTMNRPEARNALGAELLVRLADAWDMIDGDDSVRVAILTGAGGHFSSGADLKALAGGTEILQATDIRIAGESAKFGVSEETWGLFPLGGSTVRLRRQIPFTHAMELLLTGKRITAAEAARIGLIGRVVPDGEALGEARKVAEQIAQNGPLAVQAIKRSVMESEGLPEKEALARELEIGWPILSTEDAKEGPRAFAEKRKPDFKGR